MSTSVEIVRTVYDRLQRGDIQGVLGNFGNECEVEFLGPESIPFAGKYVGARGMGEALQKLLTPARSSASVPMNSTRTATA